MIASARIPWTLVVAVSLALGVLPAWCVEGDIHPLSRPGHPYQGSTPRHYAEGLLTRYRQVRAELTAARKEFRRTGRDRSSYQYGGFGAPIAAASDEEFVGSMRERTQLRDQIIPALEAEIAAVEREWNRWCMRLFRLGSFADFAQLTEDQEEYTLRWLDGQVWDSGLEQMVPYREPPPLPREVRDPPQRLGWIADASRATIFRADPERHDANAIPGTRLMQGSGAWVAAREGWQVDRGTPAEAPPRNDPVTHGPFSITPGRYRAYVSIAEPRRRGMRAHCNNTTMSVAFAPRGVGERSAGNIVSTSVPVDGQAREAEQEFTVRQPGQIWVTFGPATDRGPSGAWQQPEQTYVGYVEVLQRAPEEAAAMGNEIFPGDRIRAGNRAVTVELWDGTMVVLQPNAELTVDYPPDGLGIRLTRERGAVRLTRWGRARHLIECVSEGRIIRPKGTDFLLTNAGVEVLAGEVEVTGERDAVTLRAGEKLTFRTGRVETFDADAAGPSRAADGFPAEPDYWSPTREPFGEKVLTLAGGVLDAGWVFADPPARRGARAQIEVSAAGALHVTVPPFSRLDCGHYASDTAPRLLHKATGDFDLEAEVAIEGQAGSHAALDFLVRAPGAYPGLRAAPVPGHMLSAYRNPAGVGRSYWRAGAGLLRRGNPAASTLPMINENFRTRWPAAGDAPVRMRFSRRDTLWSVHWSRDGNTWKTGALYLLDMPETLWVGWVLENATFRGARNPVTFHFRDVRLRTAPLVTMDSDWSIAPRHGSGRREGAAVQLVLDGTGPGSVRAFSPDYAKGDFDVEVSVRSMLPPVPEGDSVRVWSVAAVTPGEQAVGFLCETRAGGTRYGLLRDTRDGYNAPTRADHWIPAQHAGEALDAQPLRIRLTRRDSLVAAHFWSAGAWQPARPEHAGRSLEGPVFLRFEAFNGEESLALHAPMTVDFKLGGMDSTERQAPSVPHPASVPAQPQAHGEPADADFVHDEAGALDENAVTELSLLLAVLRHRVGAHLAVVFVGPTRDDREPSRLATEHRNRLIADGVLPARSGLLLYTQGGRWMAYARDRALDETVPVDLIKRQWQEADGEPWPRRVATQLRGIFREVGRL